MSQQSEMQSPTTEDTRLVLVMHYLPIKVFLRGAVEAHLGKNEVGDSSPWRFEPRRGHSAMYSGCRSLEDKVGRHLYVGMMDPIMDDHGSDVDLGKLPTPYKERLEHDLLSQHHCIAVFTDPKTAWDHYEGYCKKVLWPILHYSVQFCPSVYFEMKQYWQNYENVNRLYADTIRKLHDPDADYIWIHDYHLLLLPAMLRARIGATARIGLFLHTVMPSSEIFRCLPRRDALLKGMLGANLIGFQTYTYARHFVSTCTRVLGLESSITGVDFEGHNVSVAIFPIGIDVPRTQKLSSTTGVKQKIQSLKEQYKDTRIIIGRDKLDQIKGVHQKLGAFERFLEEYPYWQGKVVLIQVTSTSHYDAPSGESSKVSDLVSRINGRYGSIHFTPVHYIHQNIEREEYYALLTAADAALITSVRDGMNTTSLEYIVCQERNCGQVILSEFTGTAMSLSAALLVNPWDSYGVAAAINEALSMPKADRASRHKTLFEHTVRHTAQFWASTFLKELRSCVRLPLGASPTPVLPVPLLENQYASARRRLLLFDYDGTLTPIRKTPEEAVPSDEILTILRDLCADPANVVYIISGRDQRFMLRHLGSVDNLGLSAEHGCFTRAPGQGTSQWINLMEDLDLSWRDDVIEVFNYYTERVSGSFMEKKIASVTWHYRQADPEFAAYQAKECQNHLEDIVVSKLPVEILIGKKTLEVRPIQINKGEIVKRLLTTHMDAEFVFCVGDDKTDEDMFRMLNKFSAGPGNGDKCVMTCTVGSATKRTSAEWHLDGTAEVQGALGRLSVSSSTVAP